MPETIANTVPTRIRRVDLHNVAVEFEREFEIFDRPPGTKGKGKPTGKYRRQWVEEAYYGHRLEQAAKTALFEAVPIGATVTPELIRAAVEEIVERTKEAVGIEGPLKVHL